MPTVSDLTLDPTTDVRLEYSENLIVTGTFVSKPNVGVTHQIVFTHLDDSLVVDTMACDPIDSNVGLWVTEGGKLDWDGLELTTDGTGHAHIHICGGVHSIKNVTIDGFGVPGKLGSYPLHFHEGGDSTRGTVVENVTVRRSGRHAFVPHKSHGITFKGCQAIDITDHAYWWDQNTATVDNSSNDITFDGCLASYVSGGPFSVAGFVLGSGSGNTVMNCVADAVRGRPQACGFQWAMHSSTWTFTNNSARDCKFGIFVWENDQSTHEVGPFTATGCDVGISHGAYKNHYHYHDVTITGCWTGINVVATGDQNTLKFERVTIDGNGIGTCGISSGGHVVAGTKYPTVFDSCVVKGLKAGSPAVHLVNGAPDRHAPDWMQFTNCQFDGGFVYDPDLPVGTRVDVDGRTVFSC